MKKFKCTKEYVLMCFYIAAVMKWPITEFSAWIALLAWSIVVAMYERSVRRYVELEKDEEHES